MATNVNAPSSIRTWDNADIEQGTDNVYESIVIMGKRSRQIGSKLKEELTGKLMEFASNVDNLEEIFENKEQIEISRFYERQPKSTSVAIQEFVEDQIYWRRPGENLPS